MKTRIKRISDNEIETIGELSVIDIIGNIVFDCDTLERPWKNNGVRISCIPKGIYQCNKKNATNNIPYDHIEICNVNGRSGIAIHVLNYYNQSQGCIGVGELSVDINNDDQQDLINSRKTFNKLMAILPNEFELEIL